MLSRSVKGRGTASMRGCRPTAVHPRRRVNAPDIGSTRHARTIWAWLLAILAIGSCVVRGEAAGAESTRRQQVPITANAAAAELLREGISAFETSDGDRANALFSAAFRADPTSVTAAFFVALTGPFSADSSARIRAVLARAAALPAAERLALMYLADQHDFDVDAQRRDAEGMVKLLPNSPTAHAMLAEAKRLTGDLDAAKNELEKAVSIDPGYAPAYNALGYLALGADDGVAIKMFTKFAELLPSRPNPHDSLGEAYLRRGDFDRAAAAFNAAIRLDPSFAAAYQGLAVTKLYAGDRQSAAAAMANFVAHAGDNVAVAGADIELAQFRVAFGDTIGADVALRDSSKRRAGDPYWTVLVEIVRGSARVDALQYRNAIDLLSPLATKVAALNVPTTQRNGLEAMRLYELATAQGRSGHAKDAAASAAALARIAKASPGDVVRADLASAGAWEAAMARHDPVAALRAIDHCDSCKLRRALGLQAQGDRGKAELLLKELRSTYERSTESAKRWMLLPKP